MSAIIIARREFYWKISQTELRIDRDLTPHTGISGIRPGIVQPSIDSELPWLGDSMEDPETLAGASVESADVTFDVGLALRHAAASMCRSNDDHVAGHGWSCVKTHLAGYQIDLLIVIQLQIDDPILA